MTELQRRRDDPDFRQENNRRHKVRREADRNLLRSHTRLTRARYVARGAVVCWALIATVGVAALAIQGSTDRRALDTARMALARAGKAYSAQVHTVKALKTDAAAECYRVNYFRFQYDTAAYRNWQRAVKVVNALRGPKVSRFRVWAQVRGAFEQEVRFGSYIPLTNCTVALTHPKTYHAPQSVHFRGTSMRTVRRALAHPPQPPGG